LVESQLILADAVQQHLTATFVAKTLKNGQNRDSKNEQVVFGRVAQNPTNQL